MAAQMTMFLSEDVKVGEDKTRYYDIKPDGYRPVLTVAKIEIDVNPVNKGESYCAFIRAYDTYQRETFNLHGTLEQLEDIGRMIADKCALIRTNSSSPESEVESEPATV